MASVPFIASDPVLLARVVPIVAACPACEAELTLVASAAEALDFLAAEITDLAFVYFSDPAIDAFALLQDIKKDAWLLHPSIIAICEDDGSKERLEEAQNANITIVLQADDLERRLPKVLDIIAKNKRILFQRAIGAGLVQTISGSFKLQNDTIEANCYVNLICNFLYSADTIGDDGRMSLHLALTEMLLNGIEHGNCGITYDQKGAWLEEGGSMSALIEKKCQDPAIAARRVLFEYTIAPTQSTFHIADEGKGFDWRKQKDAVSSGNLMEVHGRGIRMTRKYVKDLEYNDAGNSVSFRIEHIPDCVNARPALFEHIDPILVKNGDVVIREGDKSDHLFYIAKGHYDVIVHGTPVSTLSAEDIFMGEMSFLLRNRRTATVRATGDGILIRISRKDFVAVIKEKPYYAVFLARLLAERLQRSHPPMTGAKAASSFSI